MRTRANFGFCLFSVALLLSAWEGRAQSPRLELHSGQVGTETGCGCEIQPGVAAIVGDAKILVKEIERPIEQQISALQQQISEARKRALDLRVNSRLLQAEARRRRMTPNDLIQQEVAQKVAPPTEEEVRRYYVANRGSLPGEYPELRQTIEAGLKQQRLNEKAAEFAALLRTAHDVQILTEFLQPSVDPGELHRVVATVNGVPIRSLDIEDSVSGEIFSIEQEIYRLQMQELNRRINALLFEQEAARRKLSTEALLETEVTPKLKKVQESDAQAFYSENESRIVGEYKAIRESLISYLAGQRQAEAERQLAEVLKRKSAVQIFLAPPAPPVPLAGTSDEADRQSAKPLVTLVVFTDYQCPNCARVHEVLEHLRAEYGEAVRVVVRNFPLAQHPLAQKAAEAAEAAAEQGRFSDYSSLLYSRQDTLTLDSLRNYAGEIGLDQAKFEKAIGSGVYAAKVRRDYQDGLRLGVRSTPTLFLNGALVQDRSYESLTAMIEAAVRDGKKPAAQ